MATPFPSRWPELFRQAVAIIDQAKLRPEDWSFGGGTALMLQIEHRESHDVDIFIDDPQILPYLNPRTQGFELTKHPSAYLSDGSHVLKLSFENIGEIDFICSANLTISPTFWREIFGRRVQLETPEEIAVKKIVHRGARMQPRDMFDIAAIVSRRGEDGLVCALQEFPDVCRTALRIATGFDHRLAREAMGQLMIHEGFLHLPEQAQETVRRLLHRVAGKPD